MTERKPLAAPALLGAIADSSLIWCSRTADNPTGGGVCNLLSTLYHIPGKLAESNQAEPALSLNRTEAAPPRFSPASTAAWTKRWWLGCPRSPGTAPRFRQSRTPHLDRNESSCPRCLELLARASMLALCLSRT